MHTAMIDVNRNNNNTSNTTMKAIESTLLRYEMEIMPYKIAQLIVIIFIRPCAITYGNKIKIGMS